MNTFIPAKNPSPHLEESITLPHKAGPRDYRRATLAFRILRILLKLLLRSLFRVEVRGLENLPRKGGYIFAANHLSWLDFCLMLAFAPAEPRIYFIAAKEYMESSWLRRLITEHIAGVIPVDRNQPGAFRQVGDSVTAVLQGGGVLGIFPEGNVSWNETGQLLPFKKGLGYFAVQSGLPVVLAAFRGTKEPWLRKHVIMQIDLPLVLEAGQAASPKQINEAAARRLQALLATLTLAQTTGPQFFKQFFSELFMGKAEKISRRNSQPQ